MWEFLDRLVTLALPRVRDFRGTSPKAFDGKGNYTLGLKEQIIFPEIDYDKIDAIKGMNISFVTTARTDEEARELLHAAGHAVQAARKKMARACQFAKLNRPPKFSTRHVTAARSAVAVAAVLPRFRAVPHLPADLRAPRANSPASSRRAGEPMMTDPIADMLARIRNAALARHDRTRDAREQDQEGASPRS